MQLSPTEDEAQLAATKRVVHHLEVVDPHLRLAIRMAGMKMRMTMVVEVHRDRDAEEAADRGHMYILKAAPAGSSGFGTSSDLVPKSNPIPGNPRGRIRPGPTR